MSYLSIEIWVQYVTVGEPLPFVSYGTHNVYGYMMFSAKKENMVQLNFPKIPHL